jgi:hypothetical protein
VSTNNWITYCLQWSQTVQQGASRAWLTVLQELGWKSDKEGLPLAKLCEMLTTEVSAADVLDALYPQRQKKPLLTKSTHPGDPQRVKPRPISTKTDDPQPSLGGVATKPAVLLPTPEAGLPLGQNHLSRSAYYHQPPMGAKRHVTRGLVADDDALSQSITPPQPVAVDVGLSSPVAPQNQQQQQQQQIVPRSLVTATQEPPLTQHQHPASQTPDGQRHDNPFQTGLTGNYTDIYLKHVENMALLRKLQTAINQREGAPV